MDPHRRGDGNDAATAEVVAPASANNARRKDGETASASSVGVAGPASATTTAAPPPPARTGSKLDDGGDDGAADEHGKRKRPSPSEATLKEKQAEMEAAAKEDEAEASRRHRKFIAALERHGGGGPSVLAWNRMSNELGWTIDEVKVYAYRYLTELRRHLDDEDDEKKEGGNDDAARGVGSPAAAEAPDGEGEENMDEDRSLSTWTFDEGVLFDNLLARFGPDEEEEEAGMCNMDESTLMAPTRWERIAAILPNKTAKQCRDRYQELYVAVNE